MEDRERVLMNIAADTSGSCFDAMKRLEGGWSLRVRFGRPVAQFLPTEMCEKIGMSMRPGDIVRCQTNPNHAWGISELVEQTGYSDFVLRLIGGDKLLNMGNESVEVLRFMDPSRLYTGAKFKIYQWASGKAFSARYNPHADYFKKCGGVEFDGDTLIIWCRPHIWAMEKMGENDTQLFAQPKRFTLQWSDKTRLTDIVRAMEEQGFAEDFEFAPEEPTEGQAGYTKITRGDLLEALES